MLLWEGENISTVNKFNLHFYEQESFLLLSFFYSLINVKIFNVNESTGNPEGCTSYQVIFLAYFRVSQFFLTIL